MHGEQRCRRDQEGRERKLIVKPGKYAGTTDLGDYLAHFKLCMQVNQCMGSEAGIFLGISLTGRARRLLVGITLASPEGYC